MTSATDAGKELPALIIRTLLVVRELRSGDCEIFPVADPGLVSYGDEQECLEEQALFLREYLGRISPEVIARFSLPSGATLKEFEIELPREDLSKKLQVPSPISIPCIILPTGKDFWVVVLPLRHTFYVAGTE